jgi:hypothetical protein
MRGVPDAAINVPVELIPREGGAKHPNAPLLHTEREGGEQVRIKVAMMIAMAVVLLALVGGAGGTALAQTIGGVIQCQSMPCVATGDHQVLLEQVGDGVPDRMIAKGGHDHLDARAYTDDRDVAKGSSGHDLLRVNDGDARDGSIGGPGSDLCVVDAAIEASDTCERVIYK